MNTHRSAFTLVELLVCLAIIAILVGLLLPAIQAAREAARQVQCRNHIKQLSLACHNYESAFRQLPAYAGEKRPALVDYDFRARNVNMRGWNWIAKCMLFTEQRVLAEKWGQLGSQPRLAMTAQDSQLLANPVSIMYCPTRRSAEAYPLIGGFQQRYGDFAARVDYAMNAGPAKPTEQTGSDENRIQVEKDGVWQLGESTRMQSIVDGLSNTYLIGEKAMDSEKYTTGTDFGDRAPITGWLDVHTGGNAYVRFAARPPARDTRDNCLACHDFGSAHWTNWNASMGDGSVRSISYSMDLEIHRATASINGSEVSFLPE